MLAATIILFAATRLRLLAAQIQFCEGFTQLKYLRHQWAETGEIEIVELVQLLHAGVTAINQLAQALFQSLQFKLAGGNLRIAPLSQ
ncbi:hypothetical protein D3C87_1884220 [compost metagenome]